MHMPLLRTAAVLVAALTLMPSPAAAVIPAHKVYVVNGGGDFDGNPGEHNIAIFSTLADGGLVPFGDPVPTGEGAQSLELSPNGSFAYLVAVDENLVYAYSRTADGGLTPLARKPVGGIAPFGLAVAPDGKALYTANIDDATVSTFRIGADGVPVLGRTVSTGQPDVRNVIVSRDGRFLFVSHGRPFNPGPDSLVVFPILPGGTLGQARPPVPIGGSGSGMAITPDGRFLYVACASTNDVFGLRIGHDGALTPVPGRSFPAPRTPEGVAITPDGSRLYVASVASRPESDPDEAGVWTFTIDNDGSLTAQGARAGTRLGPAIATLDGRHLYTGDGFNSITAGENTVSAFDITNGPPTEIAGSPYSSRGLGTSVDGVVVR
jgi:DNA-binding beta-propeller fold protein YncE